MMKTEDVALDVEVRCGGAKCGKSTALILNPIHDTLTHIVVKEDHFPHAEYLVPIDKVTKSTADGIELSLTKADLVKMDPFVTAHYVKLNIPHYDAVGPLYSSPWVIPDPETEMITVEDEQIPPHELSVRRGARVEATDGRVGKVDEFLIDPETDRITHLVLREGHLWGKRDVLIPVGQIKTFDEETVTLKLSKAEVEALPEISVERGILD